MNIDYTLWPNTDGNLGNIKVQIPTGIDDDKWPEGDALVGNFVYKDGKLVGFVDTKALIVNDSKTTTINYDCVDIELPNIGESDLTISRGTRSKYFNVRYGTTFVVNPPSGGDDGFDDEGGGEYGEPEIQMLSTADIQRLKSSRKIIDNTCYNTSLQNIGTANTALIGRSNDNGGASFFENCELEEFSSSLANVTNGSRMFYNARYGTVEGFDGYANSGGIIISTDYMSSLENASYMFANIYMDREGVLIPQYASLKLTIDKYNSSKPCKITNISGLVNYRSIEDTDTIDSITNICKYAKLTSDQNIGEVQVTLEIQNAFINKGWKTSKTRAGDPGGATAHTLYYYNDNGKWITVDMVIPGVYNGDMGEPV